MKISKKTRCEAVFLLEIAGNTTRWPVITMSKEFGASQRTIDLIWCTIGSIPNTASLYLEAAALLRDGWMPGEDVIDLSTSKRIW